MGVVRVAVVAVLSVVAGGCASLFRGSNQKVQILTEPPNATLVVDGHGYTTPTELSLKRNKPHDIYVSAPGYQTINFKLKGKWDAGGGGAVLADAIIPGGSVLFLIDTAVGADRQFNKMATITLPPATQPTTQPITLYEYKGKLLMKDEYDAAVEQDKLFAKKKKK